MSAIPLVAVFQGGPRPPLGAWMSAAERASDEMLRLVGAAPSVRHTEHLLSIPEMPASTWSLQDRDFAVVEQVRRHLPVAPAGDFYTVLVVGVEYGGATDGSVAMLAESWLRENSTWGIAHEWGHMAGLVDLSIGFVDPFMARDTVMAYGSVNHFPNDMATYFTESEMSRIRESRWWDRKDVPLRTTYRAIDSWLPARNAPQIPNRIIVHRQGNPGATAVNGLNYLRTSGLGIHEYIEGDVSLHAQHWDQTEKHCLEASRAALWGLRTAGAFGPRGDYDAIGIETVDQPGGAPGQEYSLSQETRITLVLRCADICRIVGLDPLGKVAGTGAWVIEEHAEYDPANRPLDLGDALHIPDLRKDVADVLAGRVPFRTVGQFANGNATAVTAPPPPVLTYQQGFAEGRAQGIAAAKAALAGLK